MLIDWFTVAAQALNFLVLVVLLRWLLWGRITRAMDERRRRVEDERQEADRAREEAKRERDDLRDERRAFEEAKEEQWEKARSEVAERRDEWIEEARGEVEEKKEEWLEGMREQQRRFREGTRADLQGVAVRLAAAVLERVSGADLQSRIVGRLSEEIGSLDDAQLELLFAGTDGESAEGRDDGTQEELRVTTRWDLESEDREKIRRALSDRLDREVPMRFDTDDEITCGVHLELRGRKLALDVDHALLDLQERLGERLESV